MNIIDYLGSEFQTLDERPLGDVDSLVLACLSYYRLPRSARGAARAASSTGCTEPSGSRT